MKTCGRCGVSLRGGVKFCHVCGKSTRRWGLAAVFVPGFAVAGVAVVGLTALHQPTAVTARRSAASNNDGRMLSAPRAWQTAKSEPDETSPGGMFADSQSLTIPRMQFGPEQTAARCKQTLMAIDAELARVEADIHSCEFRLANVPDESPTERAGYTQNLTARRATSLSRQAELRARRAGVVQTLMAAGD